MIARTVATAIALAAFASLPAQAEPDAKAAKALMKANDCFNCHAPDKTKKGPSLKKTTEKYKGKEAEGVQKMIKAMTEPHKVKLEDGTEDDHKVIDTKDQAQLKNLAEWILTHK